MTLDNILEEIKKAETIVILTHDLPDGDAVGSSLALMFALKSIGKNPDVIIPEYSNCFKFLPGTSEIKTESDIEKYDLAIALDCADGKILCGYDKYFEKAKTKIVIDHHGSNKMYGDINFVNPVSPAFVSYPAFEFSSCTFANASIQEQDNWRLLFFTHHMQET